MPSLTAIERFTSRRRRYSIKDGKWSGQRVFDCPRDDALNTNLDLLQVLRWNVYGLPMVPRFMDVEDRPEDAPGYVQVTLTYSFADNPTAYRVNKATLSILGYGVEQKLSHSLLENGAPNESEPIETRPDQDGFYWRVVEGSNEVLRPEGKFLFRTAVPQSNVQWANAYSGIGHTNATACMVQGQEMAKPGELLLTNVEIPEYYLFDTDDPIVPVRYQFLFRKGGFANLKTRKFRKEPVKEYVYHEDDDPIAWAKYLENPALGVVYRQFVDENDGSALAGTVEPQYNTPPAGAKWRTVIREIPYTDPKARTPLRPANFEWLTTLAEWA